MISRRLLWIYLVAAIAAIGTTLPATGTELAAEVYRDNDISIRAGLNSSSRQVVHFGDLLVMTIVVSYDANSVSIQNLDAGLFTSAWPAGSGAALADYSVRHRSVRHGSMPNSTQEIAEATYQFQFLSCPDGTLPTCPGDRHYSLPEFVLILRHLDASEDVEHSIGFRPWPDLVIVSTTLQRDEEDQLYPFETYFPVGGYPDPLIGEDGKLISAVITGTTLILLTGGLLMWPFRSGNKEKTAAETPRWQKQLHIIREADAKDEARFFDSLRRCLVWYCNDELSLDPFVWLDLAEPGDESDTDTAIDRSNAELRALFVDLLHSPTGQGAELRRRLEAIVAVAANA